MEAPTGRRTRWLRAGSFVLVAAVSSMLFAAPVHAEPGGGETTSPPVDVPTSDVPTQNPATDPPTQAPTTEAPPPPPVTTEAPPPAPVHRFKMTVSTVSLGDRYWQGDGSAELVISIKNTGENVGKDTITGYYVFPSGAQAISAYGTGCAVANGALSFSCTLAEQALGQVVIKVNVDPGAWKVIGTGLVTAAVGAQQRTAPISFIFTTPPTPGIDLSVSTPQLGAATTAQDEPAQLAIRLRNTGTTKGAGAVEVVTPPGVDLVTFPAACKSHRRIAADRDRCDFGDVAAGRDVAAVFGLTVSAAARAELPLIGAVHGYLTPVGRDAIETRSDFTITAPPLTGADAPLPTSAPAAPAAEPSLGDLDSRRQSNGGAPSGGQLSALPFIGGIVGVVAIAGLLIVLSLRRRMRDDAADDGRLRPDEVEDVVLVPAQFVAATRPSIPRALVLPRLPSGPVAGSAFRDGEAATFGGEATFGDGEAAGDR